MNVWNAVECFCVGLLVSVVASAKAHQLAAEPPGQALSPCDDHGNLLEKMREREETVRKKGGDEPGPSFRKQNERINTKYGENIFNEGLERSVVQDLTHQNFRNKINKMKADVDKLKKLSRPTMGVRDLEKHLGKLLEVLESELVKKLGKAILNTRIEIGSIFVIDRFSIESSRKGADAQLAALPGSQVLNNLKEETVSHDPPATLSEAIKPEQLQSMERVRNKFSKIFQGQNVTLTEINQMAKIVDFVERYHGVVAGNLTSLDTSWEDILRRMKGAV